MTFPHPHDWPELARIHVGNITGDNRRTLILRNEPPHKALREITHILLQRGNVRCAELLGEPAPQRIDRPDIAHPGLLFHDRVHSIENREGLGIVKRGVGRQVDQNGDGVGPSQLRIELVAGGDRLLLVRHLVRKPVTRVQVGIGQAKARNHNQADETVKPRPRHYA